MTGNVDIGGSDGAIGKREITASAMDSGGAKARHAAHYPAIIFGALPHRRCAELSRLLNPLGADGLARTKAGIRQMTKASTERRFPNEDILKGHEFEI